ncbi:MAG: hydroxyacid dehydrogenase [Candidatus Yanofskybacteria bacterium]|nr:hydroxyacid dehydrogenase [Candidatus Yanofskybacteria bacterium]
MHIVFFEIMPGEREHLESSIPAGHAVAFSEEKLTERSAAQFADADIISVFVNSQITRSIIDGLPNLKLITTRSMGYDHIDIAYAKEKGIRVSNVTTYAAHPVAEFAFALLLAVARNIYPAYDQLREGTSYDIRKLQGVTLSGKTIGVLGTGRIGKTVCGIARGFGMNVLAFDIHPDEQLAATTPLTYAPLDDVLAKADVLSVHMPYTPETHHIINAEAFGRMKKGVILINTARGELIDTHALVAAITSGTVAGAGLDVLEGERALKEETEALTARLPDVDYRLLAANHFLIDHPTVLITPHIAFSTDEAMLEISRVTAQSISNFIAGTEQAYL